MVIEKNGKIMYNLIVGGRHTGRTGHLCPPYQLNLQGDKVLIVKIHKVKEFEVIVDDEDYSLINKLKLRPDVRKNQVYIKCSIKRNGKWKNEYLHRIIMDAPKGLIVDHINSNTLDNRKSNLRICTQGENTFNSRGRKGTSKYKGVHWDKKRSRWYAEIKKDNKKYYVGLYTDETEAAKAYDKAASKLHGEYARLNFTKEYELWDKEGKKLREEIAERNKRIPDGWRLDLNKKRR